MVNAYIYPKEEAAYLSSNVKIPGRFGKLLIKFAREERAELNVKIPGYTF